MVKVSKPATWALRLLAVGYVFFLVAWPTGLLAYRTFQDGLGNLLDTLQEPDVDLGAGADRRRWPSRPS